MQIKSFFSLLIDNENLDSLTNVIGVIIAGLTLYLAHKKIFFRGQKEDGDFISKSSNGQTSTENPHSIFVSKKNLIENLCNEIKEKKFLVVHGTAGIGKTKIVQEALKSPYLDTFSKKYEVDFEEINAPKIDRSEDQKDPYEDAEMAFRKEFSINNINRLYKIANRTETKSILFIDNYEQILNNPSLHSKIRSELIKPFEKSKNFHIVVTSRKKLVSISNLSYFSMETLENAKAVNGRSSKVLSKNYTAFRLFLKTHNHVVDNSNGFYEKVDFDQKDCELIIKLCDLVSCLPLGIKLIATRSVEMDLSVIYKNLNKIFETEIPQEFSNTTNRQITLYNAFFWSFYLIDRKDREFYLFLSLFKNGFFLDDIPKWINHKDEDETKKCVIKFYNNSLIRLIDYSTCKKPKFELYVVTKNLIKYRVEKNKIIFSETYKIAVCKKFHEKLTRLNNILFGVEINDPNYSQYKNEILEDFENLNLFITWATNHDHKLAVKLFVKAERILNEIGGHQLLKDHFKALLPKTQGLLRVSLLVSNSRIIKGTENRQDAILYIQEALDILIDFKDLKPIHGETYSIAAYLFSELGEFDSREKILSKVLGFDEKQIEQIIPLNYGFILLENARHQEKIGQMREANLYFDKALNYFKNYPVQSGKVLNQIALYYWRQGHSKKSEKNFKKAVSIYEKLEIKRWLSGFRTNLALLYADTSEIGLGLEQAKRAFKDDQNKEPYEWYQINKLSFGRLYFRTAKSDDNYELAEKTLLDCYRTLSEIDYNETKVLASIELSDLYLKNKKYESARIYTKISLSDCEKFHLTRWMRYFRILVIDGILSYLSNEIEFARKRREEAFALLNAVEDNNWLSYRICNENWNELNQVLRDESK